MNERIKLVVVGDSYVGKTSMLFAYMDNQFLGDYQTSIFENYAINIRIEQKNYTVNLFDTAGQEDFAHLRILSYPQTDVFLLCFSLVDPQSLEACRSVWMPEIQKFAGEKSIILLIGTKEDLAENAHEKSIDFKTAQRTANEIGCKTFMPCSSLTHRGLKRVFDEAILTAIELRNPNNQNVNNKRSIWTFCCKP